MTNENRKTGNAFEQRLCISLSGYGFWCHRLTQNNAGQPFDVLAARNGSSYPIDCKVCENDTFKLDRIEDNQSSSMELWRDTGNGEGWFALELSNGAVYFISYSTMEGLIRAGESSIPASRIKRAVSLRRWVELCG